MKQTQSGTSLENLESTDGAHDSEPSAQLTVPPRRLLVERFGRVLLVRFNNPPHHFFDEQMSIDLDDLTRSLVRDNTIGAVVLAGQGDVFTHLHVPDLLDAVRVTPVRLPYRVARSVMGVATMAGRFRLVDRLLRRTPLRGVLLLPRMYASFLRMNQMDKAFIAAINGTAVALGAVVALSCDIRVAAEGEYGIGLPESAVGVLAGAGGTQHLVRMLGPSTALDLLLHGSLLTPAEAHDLGLVHRVVPATALETTALAVAHGLADRDPAVIREIKRMTYDAARRPTVRAMRMEAASLVATATSKQSQRSIRILDRQFRAQHSNTGRALETAWRTMLRADNTEAYPDGSARSAKEY